MSVSKPRAYAAYARDATGAAVNSGSAVASRRLRAGIGDLQVVVVALLTDAQDLLDLRLRLEHEILGGAAADDQDAALAAVRLRVEHDRRRLVHVGARIEAQPGARQRLLGDVHAD